MRMEWHDPRMEKRQVQRSVRLHREYHASSESIDPRYAHFVYVSYNKNVNLGEKRHVGSHARNYGENHVENYAENSQIENHVERRQIEHHAERSQTGTRAMGWPGLQRDLEMEEHQEFLVCGRQEGHLVKKIVAKVLSELKRAYLVVSDFLVGVDDSVKEVLGMIGTDTDDVKILGIHGMGGTGKTTLAKIVYNKLCGNFDNCCFLADVRATSRAKGIGFLQTRLISYLSKKAHPIINSMDEGIRTIEQRFSGKKVLILLDDVDEKSALTGLLGRQGCFGLGSRILITTRNVLVLMAFRIHFTYLVHGLDPDRSLQLFSRHAFRRDYPPNEKIEQSREIVELAQGLPLALEVMGSTLYGHKGEMWDEYLDNCKKSGPEEIRSKLMISYDVLDLNHRQIFLNIACLFDGYDKSAVIYMWRDCGLYPTESLEVLQMMALIKTREDNKLWMHEQLKDLGKEIVFQESGGQLEKQNRLWNREDALDLLRRKKTNENLEALSLMLKDLSEHRLALEGFPALPNLKFLQGINSFQI
ncbi:disease resistance protein L6-like [Rhodamnia argentea]|uniref:Disease resistance protein L6-like n=1 Tax=Rhodamnia argentea TaxID=178133 RepID=A0ABM3HBV1_9MYRT|nr:disease resistance protein L6-like [Rhodamnia argentea]